MFKRRPKLPEIQRVVEVSQAGARVGVGYQRRPPLDGRRAVRLAVQ
jgi:hypothetical protein